MVTLAKATPYSNSWQIIYDLLVANLTDPESRGDNNKWIFAAFPDTNNYNTTWKYPIITITSPNITRSPLTMDRDKVHDEIIIMIDVWSKKAARIDSVADDIIGTLDSNNSTLSTNGLFNYSIASSVFASGKINNLKVHNKTIILRVESILS